MIVSLRRVPRLVKVTLYKLPVEPAFVGAYPFVSFDLSYLGAFGAPLIPVHEPPSNTLCPLL